MRLFTLLGTVFVISGACFAYDIQTVSLDTLPADAENIAREYLEEQIGERYPNNCDRITIGEVVPLYVYENEIKALSFVVEIDAVDYPTLENQFSLYEAYKYIQNILQSGHSALNDNDKRSYTEKLINQGKMLNKITNAVIVFIDNEPTYIGDISSKLFSRHFYEILPCSDFLNYGLLCLGYKLSIGKITNNNGVITWHTISPVTNTSYSTTYFIDIEPLQYRYLFMDCAFGDADVKPPLEPKTNINDEVNGSNDYDPPDMVNNIYGGFIATPAFT